MSLDVKNKEYGDKFEKVLAPQWLRQWYGEDAIIELMPDGSLQQKQGCDIVVKETIFPKVGNTIERITKYQVKSRGMKSLDFSFQVFKSNGRWYLDVPDAHFYLVYLPARREAPYKIEVEDVRRMFELHYHEWDIRLDKDEPNIGYFYISPEKLNQYITEIKGFIY